MARSSTITAAHWAEEPDLEEMRSAADSSSDGESDYRSDASESGSDGEPWHHISAVKRTLLFGGTLAFAVVFVLGVAEVTTATTAPGQSRLPADTQLATASGEKPAARGALSLEEGVPTHVAPLLERGSDGVPLQADALASPYAPAAYAPALAENKRRRPAGSVKPQEKMHDGNVCDDSEELYAGLCYTKCSILTGQPLARRSTAFSCCPTADCHGNLFKMKTVSLLPCEGFDVSSSDGGIVCPHIRGECLTDEEQFLGKCYEKCSILTQGKFPKRFGAESCCDPEGIGGCWNFGNDYTNAKLNVGGGKGDGDAETPRASHFPLKYLTENN
jgi:hypothetical protein